MITPVVFLFFMFILEGQYAVVWHVANSTEIQKQVMDAMQWVDISRRAHEGHVVIQECWDITSGKCIKLTYG